MAGQLDLFGTPGGVAAAPLDAGLTALAAALPAGLHLGLSSWAFPGWAGSVYAPLVGSASYREDKLAREGLAAYAQHPLLRGVGLDRTFYNPMSASALRAYREVTPLDFRFLVKAHDHLTLARFPEHPRYGARQGERNDRFLDPGYAIDAVVGPAVEGLGDRLGALLFQLPPQPLGEDLSPHGFAERLERFLTALPRGPRYAVELRNGQLLTAGYGAALRSAGAVHGFNAWSQMLEPDDQTFFVDPAAGPALVLRWLLPRGMAYAEGKVRFAPFDRIQRPDPERRQAIARMVIAALQRGQEVFLTINNKAEGSAPESVRLLALAIRAGLRPRQSDPLFPEGEREG